MRKVEDLLGKKFGRLTVVERCGSYPSGNAKWRCKCECGGETVSAAFNLKIGKASSCGCYRDEAAAVRQTKHGMSRTPTMNSWLSMKQRCLDESTKAHEKYGAAGVTICDRWLESFENFLADMGERPEGTTLDRRDNGGNYEPGNCRWADATTQSNNRGTYNVRIIHEGREVTAKEYAKISGLSLATVYRHMHNGKLEMKRD